MAPNRGGGVWVLVVLASVVSIQERLQHPGGRVRGQDVPSTKIKRKKIPPKRRMHPTPKMMLRKDTPLHPKSRKVHKYEEKVMKLYHLEDRDYRKWTRLAGRVRSLVRTIKTLPEESEKRRKCTNILIDELFDYGVIPSKLTGLDDLGEFTTSAFARRQLWWIVTKKKMAPDYYAAKELIEKGHVRVGIHVIYDPKWFVNRRLEQTVHWDPGSKMRAIVRRYHGIQDDYDAMERKEDDDQYLDVIESRDILDIHSAFQKTEDELVADKKRQLQNVYDESNKRLPEFKTLDEYHEFQQSTLYERSAGPDGAVIFRLTEPAASWRLSVRNSACRTFDQKFGRLPAAPGTKAGDARKKKYLKLKRTVRESLPEDGVTL